MHRLNSDISRATLQMDPQLEVIFQELGISQYLETFLEQGFDSWHTILDITESDLDALGVKLGHRRKLQRRIANSRGIAPDVALGSPTNARQNVEERTDLPRQDTVKGSDIKDSGVAKRKYRRHPKPDENAPERPPSAYVLFSNKMRDDLKGRNLTFTEIAKLVGENWQALTPAEKEPYESRAQQAKETYNAEMNQYKKTPEYRQYMQYLHEFRLKHPSSSSQDKDSQKRPRLDVNPQPLHTSSAISSSTLGRNSSGGSGSGDSQASNDAPVASLWTTQLQHQQQPQPQDIDSGSVSTTPLSYHTNLDEPLTSPGVSHGPRLFEPPEHHSPNPFHQEAHHSHRSRRSSSWRDNTQLPPLVDVLDRQSSGTSFASHAPEGSGYMGFLQNHHRSGPGPPDQLSSSVAENCTPTVPMLRQENSSAGSISSGSGTTTTANSGSASMSATTISSSNSGSNSTIGTPTQSGQTSYSSFSRTSGEASLPIHALLHSKGGSRFDGQPQPGNQRPSSRDHSRYRRHEQPLSRSSNAMSPGTLDYSGAGNGFQSPPQTTPYPPPSRGDVRIEGVVENAVTTRASTPSRKSEQTSMDGMSALLRAGEIVDRQTR